MTRFEYVLFATKVGDEDWAEQLITTAEVSLDGLAKLEKAKSWAIEQGFDRLRVYKDSFPYSTNSKGE